MRRYNIHRSEHARQGRIHTFYDPHHISSERRPLIIMKTFSSASLVLLIAVINMFSSPASADGCIGPICGAVKNQSKWQLRITDNPNCKYDGDTPARKCDNKCNIWY